MPETQEHTNTNAFFSNKFPDNTLFDKYEVGKLLGCGAFAKVYHARNNQSGQSVAIKSISKQKIIKGGLTAHVKREVSIMHLLSHPNIVKLYEVLATKTKIYFVMEFVKGGELFSKVAKGRFSEDLSRKYFQQLISAVGYCHSHGVFHRDLKPENLLLDENGNLKVSDFGLSAVTEQIRHDGMLHTLCGTPAYVAPEILAKRGYNGAKVDIWSSGVILFVLAAGYLPFNDPNLMSMYRKIYKGEFKCPKWFSPELKRFLSHLLDTNPDTRYTLDNILNDPWFKKGYKEIKFQDGDYGLKEIKEDRILNAFDIISFSTGFDLSGLFDNVNECCNSVEEERFISGERGEKIMEKFEAVAKKESLAVRKKEGKLVLVERNGNLILSVEVYQLTEDLVVVEVRWYDAVWKEKLSMELNILIHQPETPGVTIMSNGL